MNNSRWQFDTFSYFVFSHSLTMPFRFSCFSIPGPHLSLSILVSIRSRLFVSFSTHILSFHPHPHLSHPLHPILINPNCPKTEYRYQSQIPIPCMHQFPCFKHKLSPTNTPNTIFPIIHPTITNNHQTALSPFASPTCPPSDSKIKNKRN